MRYHLYYNESTGESAIVETGATYPAGSLAVSGEHIDQSDNLLSLQLKAAFIQGINNDGYPESVFWLKKRLAEPIKITSILSKS